MIRVRLVNGADERVGALLRWMQLECLPGDEPVETSSGHWWVAYDEHTPAAFAGLVASQQHPNAGYLCRAGVLPAHRGLGLQRRLLAARERKARSLGWSTLVTDTYDNPHSANNLIRAGFRMYEPPVPYGLVGTCYWIKHL